MNIVRYDKFLWIWILFMCVSLLLIPQTLTAKEYTGDMPRILSIRADTSSVTLFGTEPLNYNTFQLLDPLRLVVDIPRAEVNGDVQREIQGNRHPIIKVDAQAVRKKGKKLTRIQIYLSQLIPHRIHKRGKTLKITFPAGTSFSDDVTRDYASSSQIDNSASYSENTSSESKPLARFQA